MASSPRYVTHAVPCGTRGGHVVPAERAPGAAAANESASSAGSTRPWRAGRAGAAAAPASEGRRPAGSPPPRPPRPVAHRLDRVVVGHPAGLRARAAASPARCPTRAGRARRRGRAAPRPASARGVSSTVGVVDPVQPEQPRRLGAVAPGVEVVEAVRGHHPARVDDPLGLLVATRHVVGQPHLPRHGSRPPVSSAAQLRQLVDAPRPGRPGRGRRVPRRPPPRAWPAPGPPPRGCRRRTRRAGRAAPRSARCASVGERRSGRAR